MAEECKLWMRKMRGQRIVSSDTEPCDPENPHAALAELCRRMDVPRPMWLSKHQKEFDAFRRTAFTQDHFVEHIPFTRLELELILPDSPARRGQRNPLTDA